MVTAPILEHKMTLEEFIRRFNEAPFELIDGEIKPMIANVSGHGEVMKKLVLALYEFEQQGLGNVIFEIPFVLTYDSHWVKGSRVPDVMFYVADRIGEYKAQNPGWRDTPYILIPDLAVEIVSKNDSYSDVQDKVETYQADGVRLIWVIDPIRRKVDVYEGSQRATLSESDSLTGGGVIPGFAMLVSRLFD